ncbi:hypothetical protein PGT21_001168 [Puccinia graminis f. sp. tritici]|uniref:Uncharacterized protein n=1 Tax=Puccinia graminis f. sp. tritici TaxID=56615 RepID=A0A5B0MU25_PUCGR|nr:hypothetical protein PGT21_001168 [Puccinia graminis f. sp. tritici]KAA1079923.1 hypothetical protein PGTUg99_005007 [Puccinia graminis f. sp. tritici]
MLSAMSNGKASSRRMIYILFAGMIIALSINLSSAITCAKSFKPGVFGNVPPGKACKPQLFESASMLCSCLGR